MASLLFDFVSLADAVVPAVGADDLVDGDDRARGADRLIPTRESVPALDALELGLRGDLRGAEVFSAQAAVAEEAHRVRHAAHVEAVGLERLEPLADDYDDVRINGVS